MSNSNLLDNSAKWLQGHSEADDEYGVVSVRYLKDIVHDLIEISPGMGQIIDTEEFQRLRDIKQLGTSCYVWPSATHTRFEHCIGVAHLAQTQVENIREAQPGLGITERDVECVTIAGLCHDLGHGPWSHMWDGMFIPAVLPGEKWTHEQGSEMMLDYLAQQNGIDIPKDDLKFIKALIRGDPTRCSPQEKVYLFDIVANHRNGLDVDKFDYFLRDSLMLGDPIKINMMRILKSARVINNEITYNIKEANNIIDIFRTRFKLHHHYYNHKTGKIIEYMILDALKIAEPHLDIARRIEAPESFLSLTDYILQEVKRSRQPELAAARKLLSRIDKRDLYKLVDCWLIPYERREIYKSSITSQTIYGAVPQDKRDDKGEHLEPADIIVEFTTLHHGMKEKNPLEMVKFYSKLSPNQASVAQPGEYSTILPSSFAEVMMRVYTKKPQFFGTIQSSYRSLLRHGSITLVPEPCDEATTFATPPGTEAPTSPRRGPMERLSRITSSSVKPISKDDSVGENKFTTVKPDYSPQWEEKVVRGTVPEGSFPD